MALIKNNPEVNNIINRLLINDYATITSTLTKHLGQENLDNIDNLVQKTFTEAKNLWSSTSLPCNPKDSLWQILTDNTSDLFCNKLRYKIGIKKGLGNYNFLKNLNYPNEYESIDNKVAMMFTLCHPFIQPTNRIYLILKILAGLSTSYIARIFLKSEREVSKEISKAKRSIIDQHIPMVVPKNDKEKRLELILDTLWTIFDIGYYPLNEKLVAIPDLCYLSANLLKVLTNYTETASPEVDATYALMLFKISRLNSIVDGKGNILNLKEQDRSKWDKQIIKEGLKYLNRSARGNTISKRHLEAGIEAIHSLSPSYEKTDWGKIIFLCNSYLAYKYCPHVELQKAIAIAQAENPHKGIEAIKAIKHPEMLKNDKLYHTTLGNLYFQTHNYKEALPHLLQALELSQKPYEKNYLKNRIDICKKRIKMIEKYEMSPSF